MTEILFILLLTLVSMKNIERFGRIWRMKMADIRALGSNKSLCGVGRKLKRDKMNRSIMMCVEIINRIFLFFSYCNSTVRGFLKDLPLKKDKKKKSCFFVNKR